MKLHWSLAKRVARLRKTPRVVHRLGATWVLDPGDWIDLQLLIGRPYEVPQRDCFERLCRALSIIRFVDCGGNIGLYTVLMAKRLPALQHIDVFEPVRETRYRLTANLWLNGLAQRVTVHDCGLSDRTATVELSLDPTSSGVATVSPSDEERSRRDFRETHLVRLERLDDVLALSGTHVALKIDVEGHELSTIAGAERTLRENTCVVQVETRARNRDELVTRLQGFGYAMVKDIGDDAYFVPAGAFAQATAAL
jgi:FkbM family methyltransferase